VGRGKRKKKFKRSDSQNTKGWYQPFERGYQRGRQKQSGALVPGTVVKKEKRVKKGSHPNFAGGNALVADAHRRVSHPASGVDIGAKKREKEKNRE